MVVQCSEKLRKGLFEGLLFCRVVLFFCCFFFLCFYEGGCIPNIRNVVHSPKITLDVIMEVQVCISAITVHFIKDSAAERSQW